MTVYAPVDKIVGDFWKSHPSNTRARFRESTDHIRDKGPSPRLPVNPTK